MPTDTIIATDISAEPAPQLDWGPIIAGTALASGVSVTMFAFGSGIGLSMLSPYEGEGASFGIYLLVLGLWSLWVVLTSFGAGGYLAGRMRRRALGASPHEAEVRDGIHGLAVWGVSVLVGAALLALGVATVAGNVGRTAMSEAMETGRTQFAVDNLLRPGEQFIGDPVAPAERNELRRLLTFGMVKGELEAEDRARITNMVARRTGLTQADAASRVDQVLSSAKERADMARQSGIVLSFATAASLIVGAAAAAGAAVLGGRHRDEGTDHSAFWRWR